MKIIISAIIILVTGFSLAAVSQDTLLTVYFSPKMYQLDSLQCKNLTALSKDIAAVMSITGFTDSVGTVADNIELSKHRAYAVYEEMLKHMHEIGRPPLYLGETNNSQALWKNRKVEITARLNGKDSIVSDFDLQNVYFVPDQAVITSESLPYIQTLAGQLKRFSNASIEIVGHVNYDSKKDSAALKTMFELSEKRAKTIYLLLQDQGLSAKNLSYKGVGNTQPVIREPSDDEERKKNMRVQIIIHSRQGDIRKNGP